MIWLSGVRWERIRLIGLSLGLVWLIASCTGDSPIITPLALTGTSGAVTGRVLNGTVPLRGATVATVPNTVNAVTDALGKYLLPDIPPQTLTLTATASGFLPASKPVTILPGQTTTADIQILSAAQSILVTGIVTDGVNGVADATVIPLPGTVAVTTTANGLFSLPPLAPGAYTITASKAGFSSSSLILNVAPGKNLQIALALTRRIDGTISGIVTDGTNPVGSPLQLATISLFDPRLGTTNNRIAITTVPVIQNDPPAPPRPTFIPLVFNYLFAGLVTGPYIVQATFPGFVPGTKLVNVRPPLPGNGDIILSTDGTTGAITGTIVDPFFTPVPNATIAVRPAGATGSVGSTSTDPTGRYRFFPLTPGPFTLSVSSTLFATATLNVQVAGGETADGTLQLTR
jgi:hypothetical protein